MGNVTPKPKSKNNQKIPYLCKKDLLAILGTAGTMTAAPYENMDFEIWGVAVCVTYPAIKRLDLQFEMHTQGYWKRDPNVLKRLQAAQVPIYMHDKYPEVPNSIKYPIDAITETYGSYFTSSIAYMLAMAYHSYKLTGKPKHVAMFGIHMEADEEYGTQRPCCEYWIGQMRGAGMDVEPSPGGAILRSKVLYGYENYHPVCYEFRQRITGLQAGLNQSRMEFEKWKIQCAKQEGAITEANVWLDKFQKGDIITNGAQTLWKVESGQDSKPLQGTSTALSSQAPSVQPVRQETVGQK